MKRVILFRGKAVMNTFSINEDEAKIKIGDWVYGALIPFDDGIDLIYERDPNNPKICGCHGIDVDHNTVGEYTGYCDDKGVKIFEGDIIKYKYEECDSYTGWHGLREVTDEVVFEYGSFRLKNTYPFNIDSLWDMNNSKVEVIGNIHEK